MERDLVRVIRITGSTVHCHASSRYMLLVLFPALLCGHCQTMYRLTISLWTCQLQYGEILVPPEEGTDITTCSPLLRRLEGRRKVEKIG